MLRLVLAMPIIFAVTGCAAVDFSKKLARKPLPLKYVTLISKDDANSGFPVPVDVVIVKKDEMAAIISEMDTETWFSQKEFILPANIGDLEAVSYELISGNFEDPLVIDWSNRKDAKAVFVIAHYVDANVGKIRVDQLSAAVIHLGTNTISVAD